MSGEHQFAGGSWIGRDHRRVGRNSQDAWSITYDGELVIGVVADGCGSGVHSEVGSQIGVQLIAEGIRASYFAGSQRTVDWQHVQQYALSRMDILAQAMGNSYREVVKEYFLFTILGFVIDQDRVQIFAFGDGVVIVNDERIDGGKYPGDAPPYLGYRLIQNSVDVDPADLDIRILYDMGIESLESFLLATDGVDDFIAREEALLPGMNVLVGPLRQFYRQDRYFANPELISRHLKLASRDWPEKMPQPGLLSDDTTLIVGRRIQIS